MRLAGINDPDRASEYPERSRLVRADCRVVTLAGWWGEPAPGLLDGAVWVGPRVMHGRGCTNRRARFLRPMGGPRVQDAADARTVVEGPRTGEAAVQDGVVPVQRGGDDVSGGEAEQVGELLPGDGAGWDGAQTGGGVLGDQRVKDWGVHGPVGYQTVGLTS